MGRSRIVSILLVAVLLAAGCQNPGADEDDGSLRRIVYLTAFGATGRDAFAWVAQEKGYFRDAGLDVEIRLGAALSDNMRTLAAGRADFMNSDLIGGVISAGQGTFTGFRVFAAIHQQSLVSIVTPADGPIKKPADLAGKRLGAATASVNQVLFPAYAKATGLDPAGVTWVNAAPAQVPALLASGRVDALCTFLIGRPGIEAAAGKQMTVLPFSDALPDTFGNALTTSASLAESDPDLVRRFRDAALRGLADTLADPRAAAELLHERNPASTVAAAEGEITLMAPLTTPTGGGPLGSIDRDRLTRAIAMLTDAGLFAPGLTADEVVAFPLTPGS
ncbi:MULTISPECIES: ABC transporter substrate-binding protein [Catenuloplanes]|uniref:Thiamine pyrimidine synthase n=1 Tax=Catenuloplanes niger TaxID=587534 RepID=A0AAE3ZLA8_9ACTN|nr:ABC transporter substrate-binding protein [Catenuloplanes niger]MDR7321436.1 NitT/TauT family transport system substrate-binding protein [Catenuloplanes niger]